MNGRITTWSLPCQPVPGYIDGPGVLDVVFIEMLDPAIELGPRVDGEGEVIESGSGWVEGSA
jgi:hypothetical protein